MSRIILVEVFPTQDAEVPIYRGHFPLEHLRVEFSEFQQSGSVWSFGEGRHVPLCSVRPGIDEWDQLSFWVDEGVVYGETNTPDLGEPMYFYSWTGGEAHVNISWQEEE